ncbi:hypothetical protein V6N11_039891 [Hibiscus sabdariffa]|uniref:Dehydrogenase E1 component domain-containing protein n=1 Tax=Hibiscus sabdariffa TaxID=183260 RepID=A0ABR2RG83_9ROSI
MALCSRNSRNIINHLKSKVGSSRLMKLCRDCCYGTCLNKTNHCRFLPSTTTLPQPGNPDPNSHKKGHSFCSQRFESTTSGQQFASLPNGEHNQNQVLDFPGGIVVFSPEMRFLSESPSVYNPCYRVLDDNGQLISNSVFVQVSEEIAVKMYSNMATLQILDTIFYEAQRQGRISFYVTSIGEEAINIASAASLTSDDIVFPQGSNKHNYFTISSTIATQIPHAVGAAYSLKMDKKDACAVTYFGDGGTSEGDFHAALNFAAVTESPVIFICRNNGWAISTPTSDQFRSDGIAVRGQAYGVRSIRVDGNDALAMYSAVHTAREMAINEHRPILIEAVTYRVGHHSTSDDSTKYRPADEIEWWRRARDPVTRFRKWIETNGWWGGEAELQLRSSIRNQLLQAIQIAERAEKPPVKDLFRDVYDNIPSHLCEQEKLLREAIKKHPKDYPADVPF